MKREDGTDGQIRSEDEGLGFSKDMLVLALALYTLIPQLCSV